MSEGYVTLATGARRYFDMACMFALSARLNDRKRAVCLVTDERSEVPPYVFQLFHSVVKLADNPVHVGCTNKIRLYEASPFQRSMYVDADCLLVKRNIDAIWTAARGMYFTMTGDKRTSGQWNRLNIAEACTLFRVPYVVQMNSGVFYWERSDATRSFFARVNELFDHHRNEVSNLHQGRAGQFADEPLFGLAMGEHAITPLSTPAGTGSWMVTTWRARRCRFDVLSGESYLEKASGFRLLGRLFPSRWTQHSPIIAHFIALKPRNLYRLQCEALRNWAAREAADLVSVPLPV
jgi:hypothetical protein